MAGILTIDFDTNRNYGLDILRACAILFVLNSHSAMFLSPNSLIYKILVSFNLDGVSLFFVLSGFLIGGILIRQFETKPVTFKLLLRFWIRRWFRTIPNYFLVLTVLLVMGLQLKSLVAFAYVKNYYYFLPNFKVPMPEYLFPESWSLDIEEWFYLLVPLLMFILMRTGILKAKAALLFTAVIIIVGITGFRYYRFTGMAASIDDKTVDLYFRKQVVTRLDSLMYGVLGAYLSHYYFTVWKQYKKLLFVIGLVLLYIGYMQYATGYFGNMYYCVFDYGVQSIGFLCLFPYITELKSGSGLVYRCITRLSIISYSVYLLNFSFVKLYVLRLLNFLVFKTFAEPYKVLAHYVSFWVITLVLARLLYKYFEKPVTGLRDKFS